MRAMRSLAGVSLALFLLVQAGAQPLAAAETVPLRGGVHGDFGRIVFDWPNPVPYQARIEDERLLLRFERPADFDPSRVERILTAYIGTAEVGAGGQEIAFPLKGAFQLKHFPMDERIVVDLYQGSSEDLTGGVPAPVAEAGKVGTVEARPTVANVRQPSGEDRPRDRARQAAATGSDQPVPTVAEAPRQSALIGSPEEAFQATPHFLPKDSAPQRSATQDTTPGAGAGQMPPRETAALPPGHGQTAKAEISRPALPKASVRTPRSTEESWKAAPFVTSAGEKDHAIEPAQRRDDGADNPAGETAVSTSPDPGQATIEPAKAPTPAPPGPEDKGEMAETEEFEAKTVQITDVPQPDPPLRSGHTRIVDMTAGSGTAADHDPLAAPDAPLPPLSDFREIVERPVFSPLRRPSAAGSTTPVPMAQADIGFLKLEGTVISGQKKTALFKDLRSQELLRVRQGDELWGWKIRSISMDRVILRKGNDQRKFVLRFDKVQPKKQMSSKGSDKAEKNS